MRRVFIIHGWGGNPEEGWFPWAKKELEKIGFEVHIPAMPDAHEKEQPQIQSRVNVIRDVVGKLDQDTYFIGHSIGCQSIDRYLETLPFETRIGGVVYVAGWLTLKGLEDYEEEDRKAALPWIEMPIDFERVRTISPKSVAIFTKDDPFVDVGNAEFYREKLGSETIILESGGHLNDESNTKELPEVISAIEKMSK
ncbi:MAG TPA: alpha/beta hydrolase [Candidatus Paceibacterota bacterium]